MRPTKKINLDEASKTALDEAFKSHSNATVRKHSQCVLLNSRGYSIQFLAEFYAVSRYAIGNWLLKWQQFGLLGLGIQSGRGRKAIPIEPVTEAKMEELVQEDPLNLTRVCAQIEVATGLKVTQSKLKRFLKKKDIPINEFVKA